MKQAERPPPAAKPFEIRRGRAESPEEVVEVHPDELLGPVLLPQSITGGEAEERLKDRFGVDELPEMEQHHARVRVTVSAGTEGPQRMGGIKLLLILLTICGAILGGLYYAQSTGLLGKLTEGS